MSIELDGIDGLEIERWIWEDDSTQMAIWCGREVSPAGAGKSAEIGMAFLCREMERESGNDYSDDQMDRRADHDRDSSNGPERSFGGSMKGRVDSEGNMHMNGEIHVERKDGNTSLSGKVDGGMHRNKEGDLSTDIGVEFEFSHKF